MNTFLRMLLLIKLLVMLSLGSSMAWAQCTGQEEHASSGQVMQGELMLAAADTDSDEQDDTDSHPDEPDDDGAPPDEEEEGDSQT
ncbi:hypothetical protein [Pseudomonas citri]|uniref:hypothetical protein n=1 Tax=Pseudomonas citri TaxID=2978349 RepID=UPI0021B55592|nr:hypothetical protein [Pseudomonas citri]